MSLTESMLYLLGRAFSLDSSITCMQVNLVMDFHAHLCGCEIIGLLGGTWDPKARSMQVR